MTIPSFLRPVNKEQQQPIQEQPQIPSFLKRVEKKPDQVEQEFISDEQVERDIDRAKARTLSRAGESFLGAPGDISSFIAGIFGKEQNILPTSEKLKNISEKATGGYTKAETETEKSFDEIASDIGTMAFPGSGHYSLARNIGIPVVGNLVKQGLKYKDAGEKAQAYGKVGTMIALDLMSRNTGGVTKYVNSLYKKAEEAVPKGISISAVNLEKSLNNLEKTLTAGGKRPTTTKAIEKLSEIKDEIKDGKIDVKRLAAYRPAINEIIDEVGGFNFEIPKKLKPKTIKNLNTVKSEVIKTLDQYGEKFNPEFLKYNQSANESFAALAKSNVIANFIKDKIPYSPQSKAVQTLFSISPYVAAGTLSKLSPVTAATATVGALGYQGFKILHRVINSPTLRKYYFNTIKEAGAGNIPETTKNLKALDKAMDDNH